jgi:hypothetical protein
VFWIYALGVVVGKSFRMPILHAGISGSLRIGTACPVCAEREGCFGDLNRSQTVFRVTCTGFPSHSAA